MPELLNLTPPEEALAKLLTAVTHSIETECTALSEGLSRSLSAPVVAGESLPSFRKSTMDGYAVKAEDTFGAGESLPAYLKLTGEAKMGTKTLPEIGRGEAVLIHTGGMVPESANAVVMIEHTQKAGEDEIEVLRPVGTGENIIQSGEDVQKGTEIFPRGHRLRVQDIGGLAALGITEIEVYRRPKAAILSTGDEVVSPDTQPKPGQVRDINSYTISGTVSQAGGVPLQLGNFPDNYEAIRAAASKALDDADVLVISAGSSVSVRDMTADIIRDLGKPGVLVHGVALKPGKPTIFGVCRGKPVIGLPGNPVSALVTAWLFLVPVIRYFLGGEGPEDQAGFRNLFRSSVEARLTKNIKSVPGKEEYTPVRLVQSQDMPDAEPVFGKSNLIYTMINADGLVYTPINSNGIAAGTKVQVRLFQ